MQVTKRNGKQQEYKFEKIEKAIRSAFKSVGNNFSDEETTINLVLRIVKSDIDILFTKGEVSVEAIQDEIERALMSTGQYDIAKAFILYREKHKQLREFVKRKKNFINNYKEASTTADATVDDNSNVSGKNIGILNSEIHKEDNINISRGMIMDKLKELYPEFDSKQYVRDLENHIIYKHDENSFAGAISPYCCSITMYPFLTEGIKGIGGLSAAPKNLDSFCGMFINLIFATSAQFAGAVAVSETFLYFDYFARKEYGEDYYKRCDEIITTGTLRSKTIRSQIHQYLQQIVYSINQPAAARGMQSAFVNCSIFDKPFFDGMFGDFCFPDFSKPVWESFNWLQKEFLHWFNQERLKCMLTFPVVSATLLYKDGEFADKDMYNFICKEYAEGNSFFLYISDTVDSLSSCCFDGSQPFMWKSDTGVHITSFKEFMDLPYHGNKENFKVFHNGSWVNGRVNIFPGRKTYEVTTFNNKRFIMTDNHINVTLNGEKETSALTTDDYLMFNTSVLHPCVNSDEALTYEQGLLIGLFIGEGTFGNHVCQDGSVHSFTLSLNETKWNKVKDSLSKLGDFRLNTPYNNVYPVSCYNKELTSFVSKWTGNEPNKTYSYNKSLNLDCLLQSVEFRQGILDGWYITDGGTSNSCYTTSSTLVENMEALCTSLGKQCIVDIADRTDEAVVIRGIEGNQTSPLFCFRWYSDGNHRVNKCASKSWVKHNNSIFWRIKDIKECETPKYTYCIECADSGEPYFTLPSGLITHNCRLKNKIQTKEFNFTNGNLGVQTGSKSVISLNLNRIVQDKCKAHNPTNKSEWNEEFKEYLVEVLERVYKYQTAYNELLWDMYNSNLLPVYKSGFINLNKQYLTIGLIGLTAAADFLGIQVSDNSDYKEFSNLIFSTVKDQNQLHKSSKTTWNTELVPAESASLKLYNADTKDGYVVPTDINLYTSYMFKPYDTSTSVLERIVLHGNNYIGDYLDGGAACHINLDSHLSEEQYHKILDYAAKVGCQYITFNIPNTECEDCGFIAKQPFTKCPKCGSTNVSMWDRIIGYLTKIKNWSEGRRIEQKTRVYSKYKD